MTSTVERQSHFAWNIVEVKRLAHGPQNAVRMDKEHCVVIDTEGYKRCHLEHCYAQHSPFNTPL